MTTRQMILETRATQPVRAATLEFSEEVPDQDEEIIFAQKLCKSFGMEIDKELGMEHLCIAKEDAKETFEMANLSLSKDDSDEVTTITRVTVDEKNVEKFVAETANDDRVVGMFADVKVAPFGTCPRSSIGDVDDIKRRMCISRMHRRCFRGHNVVIAIVDTGINVRFLQSRLNRQIHFDPAWSWMPNSATGTPGSFPVSHGSMCAYDTLICAPDATLVDYALLRTRRPGGSAMDGLLSDGVIAYNKLRRFMLRDLCGRHLVVNNSWGMYRQSWDFPIGHPANYSHNPNHTFNRIVRSLSRDGADILFAAGNCGSQCPSSRCDAVVGTIRGANSLPEVTTVGGVSLKDNDWIGYSSEGPGTLAKKKPDLCGYTHFEGSGAYPGSPDTGTSAATPVVAGLIAAIRSASRSMSSDPTPKQLRRSLQKIAMPGRGQQPGSFSNKYGAGIASLCRVRLPRRPIRRAKNLAFNLDDFEAPE